MSKKKIKAKDIYIPPNVTLEQFIEGETLTCLGFRFTPIELTYRVGSGIIISVEGVHDVVVETAIDDKAARRVYHSMTRSPPGWEAQ